MSNTEIYTIKVIDDDSNYCKFIETALSSMKVIVQNDLGAELCMMEESEEVNIVLLDIYFPKGTSILQIPQLKEKYPNAQIVMLTVSEHYTDLVQSIKQGAAGYILKSFQQEKLKDAVEVFLNGGAFISPYVAKKLIRELQGSFNEDAQHKKLSKKEIEVLHLFSQGYSYEDAATEIGISVDGIRARVKSIYKKLNVSSKIAAVN